MEIGLKYSMFGKTCKSIHIVRADRIRYKWSTVLWLLCRKQWHTLVSLNLHPYLRKNIFRPVSLSSTSSHLTIVQSAVTHPVFIKSSFLWTMMKRLNARTISGYIRGPDEPHSSMLKWNAFLSTLAFSVISWWTILRNS